MSICNIKHDYLYDKSLLVTRNNYGAPVLIILFAGIIIMYISSLSLMLSVWVYSYQYVMVQA